MNADVDGPGGAEQPPSREDMLALLDRAIALIRQALREGRRDAAARLYFDNDRDTLATAAALLSAWPTFVRRLGEGEDLHDPATLPELAARFIQLAHNRARRKHYRDRQTADQVARGAARGADGEALPFDPADPRAHSELMKILALEIAEVLGARSERDRLVLELKLAEFTHEEVVKQVREALPGVPISEATVTRIKESFDDELWRRLQGE